MMIRTRMARGVLIATGVLVAVVVSGCDDGVTGQGTSPSVPTFETSTAAGTQTSTTTSSPVSASTPSGSDNVTNQPDTSHPVDPGAGPNDCKAGELKLTLGESDGAAGTVYRPLNFTNTGGRTCTVQGFPGVSYVAGDDGHQVGPAAKRLGSKGDALSVAPGKAVHVDIGFVNVQNFDPAACKPTAVRGLRIYPPHDTASVFVPMSGSGCSATPPGDQLTVRTAVAGGA